jgi:sugar phosphate isomerase/epimerase
VDNSGDGCGTCRVRPVDNRGDPFHAVANRFRFTGMKLAFSTLGVPGLPLDEVLKLATENGYEGIELRAREGEPVTPALTAAERREVADRFTSAGIVPLTVASYTRVAGAGEDGPLLDGIREHVRLAADIGAQFVRVFPGGGELPRPEADEHAARRLSAVAPYAAEHGVRVLLETHDSHSRAGDASRVLAHVGYEGAGIIWDLMHTWRSGEQPGESFASCAPYLGYVQVKDIASHEETVPLGLGDGVLPIAECLDALASGGYQGWVCWEYEAAWYPEAAPFPGLLGEGARFLRGLVR